MKTAFKVIEAACAVVGLVTLGLLSLDLRNDINDGIERRLNERRTRKENSSYKDKYTELDAERFER